MKWLPIMPAKGVNLYDDPRSLGRDECVLARNLIPVREGVLAKRGGLDRPLASIDATDLNIPIAAVMSPISQGVSDLVIFSRSTTQGSLIGAALSGATVNAVVPFDHPRPWLLPWSGKVYTLPGPYAVWDVVPSMYPFYIFDTAAEIGGTISTLAFQGTGNENVFPALAVPYKQRLVLMNFGGAFRNTIAFTDNFTADVVGDDLLASNGRAINLVAGDDGDEIVAGIEVMLTNVGSPAEAGLLILRKYGTPFLLTGDMDQTTGGTSTLDIKRISINTGCAGPYTVARTPHGIIWAGRDDVWAFDAGVLPRRIGQKIQPALKRTPVSLQYRWTAAYFDGFYRLAVFGEGAPMAETDAPGDQWWLDLDAGLPADWKDAEWWGPQQVLSGANTGVAPAPRTFGILAESRSGEAPRLFYIGRSDIGPKIVVGEYGTGPRDLDTVEADLADHDYVDAEVTAELISPEFSIEPPYLQLHDGIMMSIKPNEDLGLEADFIVDDGYKTFSKEKRVSSQGFRMGSSPTDDANETLHNKATRLAIYPGTRWAGSTHRYELRDVAGYVIDEWNRYLICQHTVIVGQWLATIDVGVYTLTDLMAALETAINATRTAGNAWTVTQDASTGHIKFQTTGANGIKIIISWTELVGIATAAQAAASLRLASYLALDTGGSQAESNSTAGTKTIEGRQALFQKASTNFELVGLQGQFEAYKRTP